MAAVGDRNVVATEQWAKVHGWTVERHIDHDGKEDSMWIFHPDPKTEIFASWRILDNGNRVFNFAERKVAEKLLRRTRAVKVLNIWLMVPIIPYTKREENK